MLTAMVAVDNIAGGIRGKDNIWAVNTEGEYHRGKSHCNRQEPRDRLRT